MPGIAGIIGKRAKEINEKELNLMLNCMLHEPFYTSGTYFNNQLGLYAGWVDHKSLFSDCLPVFNEKKDVALLFSGENFMNKDLARQLSMRGQKFDSFSASHIVQLYEGDEDRFLRQLNGWFSGILIDLTQKKVVLFNDRYGMHRIYYYENKDAFFFSSEAKSLLKIRPELRAIDMESLGQFFSFGCTLQNKSLFSNVFLLPGGSKWSFRNGEIERRKYYFTPSDWENQPIVEKETFYTKLRETLQDLMPVYFHSKQPIGMSLTGGLDTRIIMANLDMPPGKLPCYTFSGIHRDSFDVKVAHKVADVCHQPYQVLRLGKEFFSNFSNYAEKTIYISDGCHDVSRSYELYFNKLAREIAQIRVTGKYGGEILRTVSTFKPNPPSELLFNPEFNKLIDNAGKTFTEIKKGNTLSFSVFKEIPWRMHGCLAIEQSQLTLRTPYLDNDLVSLMYRAPADVRTTNKTSLCLIRDSNSALFNIFTDQGLCGNSNFLFSKFVQIFYWASFKAEWYGNEGMPQWLTKLAYYTPNAFHPERLILGHHKIGQFRVWFRNEFSKYVKEILLDKQTTNLSCLNKHGLEEIVNDHMNGVRNYTKEINMVLTLALIQKVLIRQTNNVHL